MTSRLKLRKKKYHPPEAARNSQIAFDENGIVDRAIASAQKHNIKLRAGTKDRGYGNCAFEAVINNINDRLLSSKTETVSKLVQKTVDE